MTGALERSQVKTPTLPKEAVFVPALGGEVIVRGLLLSERMAMAASTVRASTPSGGETEVQANIRARSMLVAETLARTVSLVDGSALYTVADWDVFGTQHADDVMTLFQVAQRLNGEDLEHAAKN